MRALARPPCVLSMARVTAYVDESLRLNGAGLYVLAAVLVPDGRAAAVRATLLESVPRGLRRYHWRKETPASRTAMCITIRRTGVRAVVVTSPVDAARQERARRRCLVHLLWTLGGCGEPAVVFETRRSRDRMDATIVRHAVSCGWVAPAFSHSFAAPDDECLLWLQDVVAGAVRAEAEGDPRWLAALGDAVEVVPAP